MPIDPDFPKNYQVIGKIQHADGEHYHFMWGPGKLKEAQKTKRLKLHILLEEKKLSHSVLAGLWLQLTGIPVSQMERALKRAQYKSFNGIGRNTMYLQ